MTFKELVNKVRNLVLEAKNVTIEDTENKFTSENVEGALKECIDRADSAFQSADSGKELIATAIGSPATSEQTFQEYANYITEFKGTITDLQQQVNMRYKISAGSFEGEETKPYKVTFPSVPTHLVVFSIMNEKECYYTPLKQKLESNPGDSTAYIEINADGKGFKAGSTSYTTSKGPFKGYYIACYK
ncbi:hypothetical protein NFZ15_019305 [Clostridioides difficile]|uniref:hypothetical protein n=1 Tax=Clostridioides difficile TaxID=1496 RepID=UPI00093A2973|nr:hypothetical protein [Clostridioides difficile]EGT5474355.1 hypothetical protein [Clostridioides difficile]ELX4591927.1 hypothetical protein [Clostridioides difficile]MBG0257790.1 hypothetical protein [Clostridioides difficile]MBH7537524.1 hypothetical protein [Clostridioides difficile]MBH7846731.1 hypothetical protein [Clostridioides difficile]